MDIVVIIPDVRECQVSSVSFKSRIAMMLKNNKHVDTSIIVTKYMTTFSNDLSTWRGDSSVTKHKNIRTQRKTDRDRQTDRQAGRQADRHMETARQAGRQTYGDCQAGR